MTEHTPDRVPDPITARVLDDVAAERQRQQAKGWTKEHDSYHPTHALVTLAERRLHRTPPREEDGYYYRRSLIEGIAMLVAAVETMDRRGDGGGR